MVTRPSMTKIRPDHLERRAFVYVRQSTFIQVREHTASTFRQYDLVQRAQNLGWSPAAITVIDQDQGRSGASAVDRDGFQFLIAQVGLGQAGAVLSLEASRLARSCSDWHRLLEICALTDTLVIDEDGIYDPSQYSDRLLLGILGTMSEAELKEISLKQTDADLVNPRSTAIAFDVAKGGEHQGLGDPSRQRMSFDLGHTQVLSC
jgi:DNA invertase Pin-like site-specific DNA recombinase